MRRPVARWASILRAEIVATEKRIGIVRSLIAQTRQAIAATRLQLVYEYGRKRG